MRQFEYISFYAPSRQPLSSVDLSGYGKDGWELCAIENPPGDIRYIFKREKDQA